MKRRLFLAAAATTLMPLRLAAAQAVPIAFDGRWKALNFPRLTPTQFGLGGGTLTIQGQGGSSLIYLPAPEAAHAARTARWSWSVSRSVPPTDLSRKGGDDRNIALYFVFMDPQAAARLSPDTSPRRLLSNRSARVLIYVWGGNHAAGSAIPSPYLGGRGVTIALRPSGTGQAQARADLAADYTRAFGQAPGTLVGLAVSADNDDTDSALQASISALTLS